MYVIIEVIHFLVVAKRDAKSVTILNTYAPNGLRSAYLELSKKVCADPTHGLLTYKGWNTSSVRQYSKKEETLLELMILCNEVSGRRSDSDDVRCDQLPRQQSVLSRDLQSALLLCCSAALYALWIQSRLHTSRVSLVYRTVEFPSFIGASCSTEVTQLESLFITQLDQCATQTIFLTLKPLVTRSTFLPRVHPITYS